MSVIHEMSHDSNIVYYTLKDPPAPRICYMLKNRYPDTRRRESIEIFEREMFSFIEESEDICSFEEWMLNRT